MGRELFMSRRRLSGLCARIPQFHRPDQCAVRGRLTTCLSLQLDQILSVQGSHPVSLRVIVGPSDGACSGPFRRRFGASFLTWALVSWKGLGVDRGVIRA